MSEEKKYRSYTAIDIEKYHKGLLSASEMHDLERAALDDPFLADALEGYGAVPVNASADVSELEKKLEERISGAKIVPIRKKRPAFVWLRAAVAIIFIAGAGLFIYQFGFRNSTREVAKIDEKKLPENIPSSGTVTDSVKMIPTETKTNDVAVNSKNKTTRKTTRFESSANSNADFATTTRTDSFKNLQSNQAAGLTVAPLSKDVAANEERIKAPEVKKEVQNKSSLEEVFAKAYDKKADDSVSFYNYKKNNAVVLRKLNKQVAPPTNYFRGRVVDTSYNPLPFANVTNTRDNVGTYADAKGYFTLISPDSILNVQVYSNGFVQNNNVQLRNNLLNNQVVMQEDKSFQGLVLSQKSFNTNRSPEANMKFEEPEPADGWYNYDTYIVNNIKTPEDVKAKRATGDVQVSFDVNKNGDPTNIKVEKSLCQKCDEEAIRLIKEGPKWKRKGKKSRVTVTVPFDR
jgi:TonB family protein